jgi:hypothetical protein
MKLKLVVPEQLKRRAMHQNLLRTTTTIQQEHPEQEGIDASWEGALTDIEVEVEDS